MSVDTRSYAGRVKHLVAQHRKLKRNGRLLFAGWYDRNNDQGDVNLFEVYECFPDPGMGRIETFMFPPTSDFPVQGVVSLTVTSPSELRDAALRGDKTLAAIMDSADKEVVYPARGVWDSLIEKIISGAGHSEWAD